MNTARYEKPYASEVILFRTRNEFVTNQRLIIDGQTYPLTTIDAVGVSITPSFLTVPLFQLLALVALIALVLRGLGAIGQDIIPVSAPVQIAGTVALVVAASLWPQVAARHTLWLRTPTRRARFMPSNDRRRLLSLAAKIEESIAEAKSASEPVADPSPTRDAQE